MHEAIVSCMNYPDRRVTNIADVFDARRMEMMAL